MAKATSGLSYHIWETNRGWLGMGSSSAGLCQIVLPQPSPQAVRRQFDASKAEIVLDTSCFGDLPQRLCRYLKGEKVDFPDKLDLAGATPFQRSVWEIVRSIPYGETRSYAWVAQQLGKPGGARAVGQALARNPLPVIIPCHRVVKGNGGLGGYTAGLRFKRYLLDLEADCGFSPPAEPGA